MVMQERMFDGGEPPLALLRRPIHYYRCSLPGLAGFAASCRGWTNRGHHKRGRYSLCNRPETQGV